MIDDANLSIWLERIENLDAFYNSHIYLLATCAIVAAAVLSSLLGIIDEKAPWIHRYLGIILSSILAVLILLVAISVKLIVDYQQLIIEITSNPLFLVPACMLGLVFYWLRGRYPLIYGSLELIVSLITISFSIAAKSDNLLSKSIGLLGGIYIMVRRLDNIDKGIPQILRPIWDRLFPKKLSHHKQNK